MEVAIGRGHIAPSDYADKKYNEEIAVIYRASG